METSLLRSGRRENRKMIRPNKVHTKYIHYIKLIIIIPARGVRVNPVNTAAMKLLARTAGGR